ncbi:hypothetical protein, partial [Vibrio crassostreae]|uniref:hypothetical protein n=1 Tax=Vibrio crassostreae TaxID=246167 RepID=UPI004068D804
MNHKKSPAGPEVPISCVTPLFTLPPIEERNNVEGELVNNFPFPVSNKSIQKVLVSVHALTSTLTVLLVTPSLVAVIVVWPTLTPDIKPVGVTVAVL